jgi:hypothetical protein
MRFRFISFQMVKPLTVRTIVMCYERNRSPRSKNWRGANSDKDATKNYFSVDIKKLLNVGTDALKSRGITLKSDISFVSVYLK